MATSDATAAAADGGGSDFDDAPWIYACLCVTGAFDPAELDRLLGVQAKTHRKGDPRRFRKDQRRLQYDIWHYSTPRTHDWDWAVQLQHVLDIVAPRRAQFIEVTAHLEVAVHLVAAATISTPFATISPLALSALAGIGCSLEFDLYCGWEPHDHEILSESDAELP